MRIDAISIGKNPPESIALKKKQKEEAETKKKQLEEARKKQAEEDARRKAEEEAARKAQEEADRKQAEYDEASKQYGDLFGSGKGKTNTAGNQGDPNGDPNAKNLEGISTGSGTVGGGLGDRGADEAQARLVVIEDGDEDFGRRLQALDFAELEGEGCVGGRRGLRQQGAQGTTPVRCLGQGVRFPGDDQQRRDVLAVDLHGAGATAGVEPPDPLAPAGQANEGVVGSPAAAVDRPDQAPAIRVPLITQHPLRRGVLPAAPEGFETDELLDLDQVDGRWGRQEGGHAATIGVGTDNGPEPRHPPGGIGVHGADEVGDAGERPITARELRGVRSGSGRSGLFVPPIGRSCPRWPLVTPFGAHRPEPRSAGWA